MPHFRLQILRAEHEAAEAEAHALGMGKHPPKPSTRAGCEDVPRPCPYVSCKYNLFLDVLDNTGAIKVNFPDREDPSEMPADASCTLDVADSGGATLEEVGAMMNVTRERIRQIEAKTVPRLAKRMRLAGIDAPGILFAEGSQLARASEGYTGGASSAPADDESDDFVPEEIGARRLFVGESEADERRDAAWVWDRLGRFSRERAIAEVGGAFLTPAAQTAVAFIEETWEARGRGPVWAEIANRIGIAGDRHTAMVSARNILGSALELGVVVYDRLTGARVVRQTASKAPMPDEERPNGARAPLPAEEPPPAPKRRESIAPPMRGEAITVITMTSPDALAEIPEPDPEIVHRDVKPANVIVRPRKPRAKAKVKAKPRAAPPVVDDWIARAYAKTALGRRILRGR